MLRKLLCATLQNIGRKQEGAIDAYFCKMLLCLLGGWMNYGCSMHFITHTRSAHACQASFCIIHVARAAFLNESLHNELRHCYSHVWMRGGEGLWRVCTVPCTHPTWQTTKLFIPPQKLTIIASSIKEHRFSDQMLLNIFEQHAMLMRHIT